MGNRWKSGKNSHKTRKTLKTKHNNGIKYFRTNKIEKERKIQRQREKEKERET